MRLELADCVDSSKISPDRLRAGTLDYVKDFSLDHSLSGLDLASIEISSSF
jgi:hypothetical protein